jgi:glycosyltransferase involved in cell wall biosynthesis
MKPLVLQIVSSLNAGGAERFAIELTARLPEYGYRTKLIVLFTGGPLRELVRERNIHWVQMVDSTFSNRWSLMKRLRNMIHEDESRRPAIVHTNLFGADFWGALSQVGIPHTKRPVMISTAHNTDPDDSFARLMARRLVAPMFDRVVSVSDEVKQYTVKKLGVSPKRAMMINGMCLIQPGPRPHGPFHHPPRFVSVGRLVPQKGYETILRALADVPPPWHYTILGTGPLERDLKELAERLGIASRVEFAGVTMHVSELLQSSDLFFFPSRWEGLGSVALEAGWAGVPVLTSDIDPLRLVFPSAQRLPIDDVPTWTKAINAALATSDELLVSASKLAPTIVSRFHPDAVTKQYAELYDKLLKERDRRSDIRDPSASNL